MEVAPGDIEKTTDRAASWPTLPGLSSAELGPDLTLRIEFDQPGGNASIRVVAKSAMAALFRAREIDISEPFPLDLNATKLAGAVAQCRQVWNRSVIHYREWGAYPYSCASDIAPAGFASRVLPNIANEGRKLWSAIFTPLSGALRRTRAFGDALQLILRESVDLEILIESSAFLLPWAMLYVGPEPLNTADFFLGARHIAHHTFPGLDFSHPDQRGIGAIGLHLDEGIDLDRNTARFGAVADITDFLSGRDVRPRSTKLKLSTEIGVQEESLYYFLCHGFPTTDEVTLAAGRIDLTVDPRNPDRSVAASDIKQWCLRRMPLKGAPIVFLNACSILRADAQFFFPFSQTFLELGACAVIGPDIDMPVIFARDFAREYIKSLVATGPENSLGRAMLRLRQDYLRNYGNPLALAYSLYGSATAYFSG